MVEKGKIGLALGGGGARGLAHIGVLKVFERHGIPIDLIAGTSMGGLVGALYASGVKPEDMEKEMVRRGRVTEWVKLVDFTISTRGIVKGARIYDHLAMLLGKDLTFDDLRLPLSVVSTDLRSGREVVLQQGKIVDAVRATISIPLVFLPVERDGMKLVDGGVVNNVPVSVARQMGAQKVIAVDVLPAFGQNQPGETPVVQPLKTPGVPQPMRDTWHVILVMISELTAMRLREDRPEFILRPNLPTNTDVLVGFDRPGDIIRLGEECAEAALPDLRRALAG